MQSIAFSLETQGIASLHHSDFNGRGENGADIVNFADFLRFSFLIFLIKNFDPKIMISVQDKLVSSEVVEEQFVCNLNVCKGACCVEGDTGAPLEPEELAILDQLYPIVRPYLTPEGQQAIDTEGGYRYFNSMQKFGTQLVGAEGACAWLTYEPNGIAKCGIEKAWEEGKVNFQKPISCHLYPIRIEKNESVNFEALNYDRWKICRSACKLGKSLKVPVYQFLKNALIRKYGEDFYNELDAAAQFWLQNEKK